MSIDGYIQLMSQFGYQGVQYTLPGAKQEEITGAFPGMCRSAYKSNGVVFACMLVRMLLFSEARFLFRDIKGGRPGKLFSDPSLDVLRAPWPGATTGDLLSRAIQYADLAGNAFFTNRYGGITPLRPDWMKIVIGSPNTDAGAWDPDAKVVGYVYKPGGSSSDRPQVNFLPEEISHFAPIPDPEAQFRGMSWLTPIVREVMADKAATEHKLKFFENGATPNLVVKLDVPDIEKFKSWIEVFKHDHQGSANAYKTMFLGAGADATVVGADMQQLEFKVTQGAGETRIAAAAGVPPVIVGLSEGLASATYSNYQTARRRFADMTMRPLWRNMAGSLQRIVPAPNSGSELWYDDRDIPALQEDRKDAAEIQSMQAASIKMLVDAGFEADTAIAAITTEDFNALDHSGMFSVQLQPAGSVGQGKGAVVSGVAVPDPNAKPMPMAPPPATNGKAPAPKRSVKRVEFSDGRVATVTTIGGDD